MKETISENEGRNFYEDFWIRMHTLRNIQTDINKLLCITMVNISGAPIDVPRYDSRTIKFVPSLCYDS